MTRSFIRRVHKDYVELEKQLNKKYRILFGTNPSQSLTSQIIVRLINRKTITLTKRGRKIKFSLR